MIYFKTDENNVVSFIHMQPELLSQSHEELLKTGFFAEVLPKHDDNGMSATLKYDGDNLYYEYFEVEPFLTLEEQIKQLQTENESLRASQAEQDALIMELMIGGTL